MQRMKNGNVDLWVDFFKFSAIEFPTTFLIVDVFDCHGALNYKFAFAPKIIYAVISWVKGSSLDVADNGYLRGGLGID